MSILRSAGLILFCAHVLFVQPGYTQAPTQPRIAFSSRGDIWLVDLDGKNLVNLTQTPNLMEIEPAWSPDGRFIYFASAQHGRQESDIYRMDADGQHHVQLTQAPGVENHPAVSPDGKWIAFDQDWRGIYLMDANGGNRRQLTNFGARPAWSPDGTRIAFEGRGGRRDIYLIDVDGKNLNNLTKDGTGNYAPAWSPDGTQIAYGSWRDGDGHEEIYVMDADGKNPRRLTHSLGIDTDPVWSPDGKRIAFTAQRDPIIRNAIYLMDADGSRQRRFPRLEMNAHSPDWFDPAFAAQSVELSGKMWTLWGRLKAAEPEEEMKR